MTVLYFQGFILLSIFLVRIVVRRHLALVCVLWTAFTLFSVFYSPLVILQLITIWGSYIALDREQTSPAAAKSAGPLPFDSLIAEGAFHREVSTSPASSQFSGTESRDAVAGTARGATSSASHFAIAAKATGALAEKLAEDRKLAARALANCVAAIQLERYLEQQGPGSAECLNAKEPLTSVLCVGSMGCRSISFAQ